VVERDSFRLVRVPAETDYLGLAPYYKQPYYLPI